MAEEWKTQNTLLMRAKDPNDHEAWDEFVKYYQPFIEILIYKIAGNHAHKDDLRQTVLLELWKSLARFEIDSARAKFRTWMSRVLRNTVLDYLKRERRQPRATEIFPDEHSTESELDELIQREWEIHLSRIALKNVSKRFTGTAIQVFEKSLEGTPLDEICSEYDLTPGSVYTLRNRVKKYVMLEITRLQERLEA
ncbi:MAG: sigma-70 family RNA polymerase sigma factor [Planctomycetes bacterium]|nr:sigma-70 family RNA polymerase sigma factor [Planctomycetota bacterium]